MATIEIRVNGVRKDHLVLWESANFESQVGAVPGTFSLTIKDPDQTESFTTGDEITLDIDSTRFFGGYITKVTATFPFDAVNPCPDPGAVDSRQWLLQGVDYNILFDKRIVYNKAAETEAIPLRPTTDTDTQILSRLFSSYLDISGDGLDTSTKVSAVADPTPSGQEFGFVNPGTPWRKQMEEIANITGAIWYINPNKQVVYTDVESLDSTWDFADIPNPPWTYGFREFSYSEDATNIANHALVWGGSEFNSGSTPVFAEMENTASISAHGRWQKAETHFGEAGFFEEDGCLNRANIMVTGEPGSLVVNTDLDSQRGLQNPQRQLRLVWMTGRPDSPPSMLAPGTVIDTYLYTYGTNNGQVLAPLQLRLPVRQVRISFVTPTEAKFSAFLGTSINDPWTMWAYLRGLGEDPYGASYVATISDGLSGVYTGQQVCQGVQEAPDGARTLFTVSHGYFSTSTQVFLDGILQRRGYEYSETSNTGGTITFVAPPAQGTSVWVCYTAIVSG